MCFVVLLNATKLLDPAVDGYRDAVPGIVPDFEHAVELLAEHAFRCNTWKKMEAAELLVKVTN